MVSAGVGIVETQYARFDAEPLGLESGASLRPFEIAYETYGKLNQDRSNAVLIFHALSGDAHVAGFHSESYLKPGWWDFMVGPGRPFDTDRYFMICANVIGGCKGSTGPGSINPKTGKSYGLEFPIITIRDMVRGHARLLDKLGVERPLCAVGGSMGGMQALQWAVDYPERAAGVIVLASTSRLSAQGIAFNEVGRRAIMTDPKWKGGDYSEDDGPDVGLSIARMVGHITYLSEEALQMKFGRRLQNADKLGYDFRTEFQVESYLRHQGLTFTRRFDANTYLYITKAMDYFDLPGQFGGSLVPAFKKVKSKFLVVSFTSDWLYPPSESRTVVKALQANGVETAYLNMESPHGHDSFLLDIPGFRQLVAGYLDGVAREVIG